MGGAILQIEESGMQKAMIILSIGITCLIILLLIHLFVQIRDYQEDRTEEFDESVQMDQIDYLIGLLEEQELILKKEMKGRSNDYVEEELARFIKLHSEFSDQLNDLHLMMVGMSMKIYDEESRGDRNKKKTATTTTIGGGKGIRKGKE